VRRKQVLVTYRNAHSEDALQQHAVGGLRTGSVHRCYVDAEVVHYALARGFQALFLTQDQVSSRHSRRFRSKSRAVNRPSASRATNEIRFIFPRICWWTLHWSGRTIHCLAPL